MAILSHAEKNEVELGLPVGLQLTGRRFDEATLLRIADAYERETPWRNQEPPITAAR